MTRPDYTRALTGLRAAAFGSFVLLGALISVRYAQTIRQVGTMTSAQRVDAATSQLLRIAVDVQNAARGFALTGDQASLAQDGEWRALVPLQIQELQQASAGDVDERTRATAFLGQFSAVMSTSDAITTARRHGGVAEAEQAVQDQAAFAKLNDLRDSATALVARTRDRLIEERDATRSARMVTGYLMLGTFISAIGMLVYAGVYMRRELRRRGDAEAALLSSRADVERQIEFRTRELLAARSEAEAASHVKDHFLAAVSHELRTPLNAIVGWTHILKIDPGENRTRALEAIERNAHVQTRLIDDLLDVSRMNQGRFGLTLSSIDLRAAVQSAYVTLAPAAAAKGISLVVRADDEVFMRGDEARLQQVAWNLLSNAVKFTPKGGSVTVDVARSGETASLCVTDNGEGIEASFLPFVFDPFRQGPTRSSRIGLGLGLAIVKQIVDQHGGTVVAESRGAETGSTFTVRLPTSEVGVVSPSRRVAPMSSFDRVSARVLVVEDNADSAETLASILQHRGCEVRVAATVAEAVTAFDAAQPDLLLCDIGLPDGDGCGLLRELRRRYPSHTVPAIALSALARDEDRHRALDAGFGAYVTKPYEVDQLFEQIRRVRERRAS